ncbi:MAG TPA: hypothetical protein VK787_01960, partial [Puia sp.]|jgi:hypothetical protein|nr:hypothetical protein [Puia sp.]
MKKVFISILSILYLVIACGFAVNIQYCMGRVSSINYACDHSKICSRCGMENKTGCCHSEFKIIKLSDDQQTAKANVDIVQQPELINYFAVNVLQVAQGLEKITPSQYYSPPDKRLSAVYLHNCVFRI